MANPFQLPITLCLLVLSFALYGRYGDAEKSQPASVPLNSIPLYLHGPGFALADLNGDQQLDLAEGLCLGSTKDGYFYTVQLRLRGDTSSNVFTDLHTDALGLTIPVLGTEYEHAI